MADIARLGPPSKKASSAPGASAASGSPQSVAGSRSAGAGAAGPGPSGRHAAARAGAKELLARQQVGHPQPQAKIFQFPPAFEAAVARQAQARALRVVPRCVAIRSLRPCVAVLQANFQPRSPDGAPPAGAAVELDAQLRVLHTHLHAVFRCARVTWSASSVLLSLLTFPSPQTRTSRGRCGKRSRG
jgi:hypothetical protein